MSKRFHNAFIWLSVFFLLFLNSKQIAASSENYSCASPDCFVVTKKNFPDVVADLPVTDTYLYGWEFYGLTEDELVRKVADLNSKSDSSNKEVYKLKFGEYLQDNRGRHFRFEYCSGRICKLMRWQDGSKGFGDFDHLDAGQWEEGRKQTLANAIADATEWITRTQADLNKHISSSANLDRRVKFLSQCYVQRAILFKVSGQIARSEADCNMAKKVTAKYKSFDIDRQLGESTNNQMPARF